MTGNNVIPRDVRNAVRQLSTRYRRYEELIKYPGDWGERAFRFWLIKELFMDVLGWRTEYIVFGERYDVLLLDECIRPKIYVETKKPGIQIIGRHVEEALRRAEDFYSIDYVIVTNGITWILYDRVKNTKFKIDNIEKTGNERVIGFFSKIHAKNYVRLNQG